MSKEIPGPKGWPLIGNLRQVDSGKLHVTLNSFKKTYGSLYKFSVFSTRIIVISDKEFMERAFSQRQLCYRPDNYVKRLKYDGSGYLDSNFSDKELALKSVLWKAISTIEDDAVLKTLREKELYKLLDSLKKTEDIPIVEYLTKTAAKLYSTDLMGIEADDKHGDLVVECLDAMNNLYRGGKSSKLTKMPWLRYVPGSIRSAVLKFIAARDQVVRTIVSDARANEQEAYGHGILQHLLAAQNPKNNESMITDQNLNACTMDLLFNAVLPTAENVAYILLQAIKHPHIQDNIHEELSRVSTQQKTIVDIRQGDVPYTMAVILECMRYLSLVNISVPHYVNEDTEVDGYLFPRGSTVLGNLFGMHHDEEFWEEPWTLRPERFLDGDGNILPLTDPLRKRIVHFGLGMRKCQGPNIAMEKIFRLVLGIFSKYRVLSPTTSDLPSSDPREYPTIAVITLPKFGVRFEEI